MLLAGSLQAVAHGSDSVLYFQLRQSQGASEKFHGAVIDHYGKDDTRVFREVTEVGEVLEQIQETVGTTMRSQAACSMIVKMTGQLRMCRDREM